MRHLRWVILFFIISGIACLHQKSKIPRSEIIPENSLIPILVEMHLADGLMNSSQIRQMYPGRDSISNYQDILQKYGYEKETFDRTIRYYSDQPDDLDDLYENVISELTKLESEIQKTGRQMPTDERETNLWNQKEIWHLPLDGETNRIDFNIPVKGLGQYTLTATILMHEDDESIDPSVTAYFWLDDGSELGHVGYYQLRHIEKNGRITVHSISHELKDDRITHFRGSILDHAPQEGQWKKHADVLNIKVHYMPLIKSNPPE
ncbi:MAG: DUF4296 domain-containing protein [Bacteroidales bacterium]|nr:MAG: DUF4296 domain-containing protein [Bacteroidales bacterium]